MYVCMYVRMYVALFGSLGPPRGEPCRTYRGTSTGAGRHMDLRHGAAQGRPRMLDERFYVQSYGQTARYLLLLVVALHLVGAWSDPRQTDTTVVLREVVLGTAVTHK